MKTIFITSFFGLIARNILVTDFLKILSFKKNLRIVILVPQEKLDLYSRNFASENIIVEGIPSRVFSRLESLVSSIFLNSSDTSARRIYRLIELKQGKKYLRFLFHWFLSKSSGSVFFRQFLRYSAIKILPKKDRFKILFKKYQPDFIFSTDIFEVDDIDLLCEAKSKKVFTIGMIRSWDNITTKGLNPVVTDKLVVNTPKIKDEALRYCDFKPENIFVVGIPHYDAYVTEKRTPKDVLFKELNFNPAKKTVFFAAPSDIYTQGDPVTEKVVSVLNFLDVQIILRLYIVGSVNLGGIKTVPGKLFIDDPGSGKNFAQADLIGKDARLADLICHSDVVVAFASTLAIDAIVFDKPVVFVGFDGSDKRPYWKSLRRFYDYDHQKSILETGGVILAKTPQELLFNVDKYISDPGLDSEKRKHILDERCWKLDGRSGERLAEIIINIMVSL